MTKKPDKKEKARAGKAPRINQSHNTKPCKTKDKLLKAEITKIKNKDNCKAARASKPVKKGKRGIIKTLPPTPNQAEQKPEIAPKKIKASSGDSRWIAIS